MNGCCPSRSSVPPQRLSQALQVSRDRTNILGPDPESLEGPSSWDAQKGLVSLREITWASISLLASVKASLMLLQLQPLSGKQSSEDTHPENNKSYKVKR